MTNTTKRYNVHRLAIDGIANQTPFAVGLSLAEAARLVGVDESDILFAIEEEGVGTTDEFAVFEKE